MSVYFLSGSEFVQGFFLLFVKMCIVVGDSTIKSVMFRIPLLSLTHAHCHMLLFFLCVHWFEVRGG